MKLLLQKHYVFDMDHGFIAKALTWSGAKRKARKYMSKAENYGEVVIVTKRRNVREKNEGN